MFNFVAPLFTAIMIITAFFFGVYVFRQDTKLSNDQIGSITYHKRVNTALFVVLGLAIGSLITLYGISFGMQLVKGF